VAVETGAEARGAGHRASIRCGIKLQARRSGASGTALPGETLTWVANDVDTGR
jgi:hypothetical protein